MTDPTRVTIGRSMAGIAMVAAVVGIVWIFILGLGSEAWTDWIPHNALIAIGAATITWFVLPAQPRNNAVWVFTWAGFFTGLEVLGYAFMADTMQRFGIEGTVLDLVPNQLPFRRALVLQQVNWLWLGVLMVLLVLPLFPDGRPPSPRWRPVVWGFIAALTLNAFGLFWQAGPSSATPIRLTQDTHGGFASPAASIVTVSYPMIFLFTILGVAALLVRYRTSRGEERQQFRWVAWGSAVLGVLITVAFVADELAGRLDIALYAGAVGMLALIVSFGIAIGRYRLYDIDLVISRSFVYGALALFITVSYIAVVVGTSRLLGLDASTPAFSIVATGAIAAAVQPVRRRLDRVANRLVYGRRATPYEVLSDFSRRVAAADESGLSEVAALLVEGTSATAATVWLTSNGDRRTAASYPADTTDGLHVAAERPVLHQGEVLGSIALLSPRGERLDPGDLKLIDEVASGLGLALRNLRLTDALRSRVEELRESRRRVVAVRDATRRSLERDLHDGAQQQLVALKVKLGLVRRIAEQRGASRTLDALEDIAGSTDQAIARMRDFARGLYPPLLESEGLGPALTAQVRKTERPVTVEAGAGERFAARIESTLYFSAVQLADHLTEQGLPIEIRILRDNGCAGIDLVHVPAANWSPEAMSDVVDRVAAVDGTITTAGGALRIRVPEVTG